MKKLPILLILLIISTLAAQHLGVFDSIENSIADIIYQTGGKAANNIYVIGIDEETLSEYGAFETWSRDKIADVINLLSEDEKYKPAVIAVDVGFYGNKDQESDDKLVQAVANAGNVVLVDTATFGNVVGKGNEVIVYEEPFAELEEACFSHGHANVNLDEDGVVRHTTGDIYYNGETKSSFDLEIYRAYLNSIGEDFNESSNGFFGKQSGNYIVYSGKSRTYYGSVGAGCSLYKVLNGEYSNKAFKNAIVLIGAYASGMQDNYYTSIEKDTKMNGVEIHANIVNQLINGDQKIEFNISQKLLLTLLVGLISIVILTMVNSKIVAIYETIFSLVYAFAVFLTYEKLDTMLIVFAPLFLILILTVADIAYGYIYEYREKQRLVNTYAKYLSPEVAKIVANVDQKGLLQLGGIKKHIAVLFVDIRGFTTISESNTPETVVEMLNKYFNITTNAIFKNDGTVDKFIGDATMGVFNAPLDVDDYVYKAVCAGLMMASDSQKIDEFLPEEVKGKVRIGVGVNCGEAIVGNVGTNFRMEYTAIGDTVNTASRLEGMAKGGEVIISQAVYDKIKGRIQCEDAGQVQLKGKLDKVQIYRAIKVI